MLDTLRKILKTFLVMQAVRLEKKSQNLYYLVKNQWEMEV